MDPSQKLLVDEIEKRLAAHFDRLERQFDSLERKVDADQKCVIPLPPPDVTPAPTPTSAAARGASRFRLDTDDPKLDSEVGFSLEVPFKQDAVQDLVSAPRPMQRAPLRPPLLRRQRRAPLRLPLLLQPWRAHRPIRLHQPWQAHPRRRPRRAPPRPLRLRRPRRAPLRRRGRPPRLLLRVRGRRPRLRARVGALQPRAVLRKARINSCSASAVVNLAPADAMERSSKEHLLAASLQANIRAYTPDVGTGYFAIDLRSSCRIVLPAGRYSCWCDIHRLERGALKAENRGWIRAVLDPMPSSPPTSTANLELALGATSTAATRSDFSVAPRLVNRGASATCSTKCQGGVVNVVAPVAASAVAMALFIISTRVADTSTAIDAVCSIVTFDADSGGVVSTSLFSARMPGAPVLFGSSDVAVEQSWLLFSSAWIDRQPWPPPHVQAKFEYSSADIRPSPWPSFLLRNHGAMGSVVSSDPPWPLQSRQDIRCVPATVLNCMMISASIVACGLILKLAQQKCGGNRWCLLLECSPDYLELAGTCPDEASVYMASGNYMIMSGQLDDIYVVGLPVRNPVHHALSSDSTHLLPWPSFSTYAASVQLGAFLSVVVHDFGISWALFAAMRPISSMVLLLSIFGHSANMLALDGPVTLVGILDWCRFPRCFLLLSSNWPVKKKRQLFGVSMVQNLEGYSNMNMLSFELHSILMQQIKYASVHFCSFALNSILASLKGGNHLKLAVLVVIAGVQLQSEIQCIGVRLYSTHLLFLHCYASVLGLGLGTSKSQGDEYWYLLHGLYYDFSVFMALVLQRHNALHCLTLIQHTGSTFLHFHLATDELYHGMSQAGGGLSVWIIFMASRDQQVFYHGKYMAGDNPIMSMFDGAGQQQWSPLSQVGTTIYQTITRFLYGHEVVLPKPPWLFLDGRSLLTLECGADGRNAKLMVSIITCLLRFLDGVIPKTRELQQSETQFSWLFFGIQQWEVPSTCLTAQLHLVIHMDVEQTSTAFVLLMLIGALLGCMPLIHGSARPPAQLHFGVPSVPCHTKDATICYCWCHGCRHKSVVGH